MSEYDEPGRPDAPERPEDGTEDTKPLGTTMGQEPDQPAHQQPDQTEDTKPLGTTMGQQSGQPAHQQPAHQQPLLPGQQPQPHVQPPRQPPRQPPYAYQPAPMRPYAYPLPATAKIPGWLWPVVALTALLIGLVGGTIGGVVVSSSLIDRGSSFLSEANEAAPPLPAENGSVAAVAGRVLPSTVQILARNGEDGATGSGFVIDRRGHVITNNHVVAAAAATGRIQVIDHDGAAHSAEIVGRSPVYDIAVLKLEDARDLRPAALGSSRSMHVGETVVAIGSPLGLDSTVTSGIISALDRPVTTGDQDESSFINAVQTDAAINPGNSGGPLVNLRGQVVGVNSAIATLGGFTNDAGNIGVGFAIPMEQVKITAAQILDTGEAKYPVIGANVNTGPERNGAEVVDVPAGTPADDAGLEVGDIVVSVDDVAVTDGIGLIVAIRTHLPGETVSLQVKRDGRELTVRVELDAKVG